MSNSNLSKYHPVVSNILNLLEEGGYWYETFEHEAVRTSEEASTIRDGYNLKQGAKALIVRIKLSASERKFVMLVMPGDTRFDIKKVKKLFNAKDSTFASEEEVSNITGGVLPGGVPPFGHLFDIEVVADISLFENEKIAFNAGDRCFSIGMKTEDFRDIVNPRIESIV
jgi:Ala-tRNA(Pro) deacylase